jgi:hypothetical protein
MIVNRIALPRRTVLRGAGAALALPFLEAMVPAFVTKAATRPVKRFGVVYCPNGMVLQNFVPPTVGPDFEIRPILRPLEQHRKQLTIVSGLANAAGDAHEAGGNGPHSRTSGSWLSGTRPRPTEGADIGSGRTADQYAADALGDKTPLRSLEIALEPNFLVGSCEGGYSCTYINTIVWGASDRPLQMETNPAVVFERLFGDAGSGAARLEQLNRDRSLLDALNRDLGRLQGTLGPSDRRTVGDYLDAVRDVERRIQQTGSRSEATLDMERPFGIPAQFEDHALLMADLIFLALRTDMTRVFSFQMARELSIRSYPEIGVVEAHHDISHHGNKVDKVEGKSKIDQFHMKLLARLIDRMAATREGEGTMLENSMVVIGSGFGDGNLHWPHNLPIAILGSGGGALQAGRHIRAKIDTPFMNLCLSLLDKLDVPHVERIGDSTGRLAEI